MSAINIATDVAANEFEIIFHVSRDETMYTFSHEYLGKVQFRFHFAIALVAVFSPDGECIGEFADEEGEELFEMYKPLIRAFDMGFNSTSNN